MMCLAFLTEAASVQTATPIYIEPTELRVYGKGLSEYKKSINMLLPWEGGWWRLGDIVEYELSSTTSIFKTNAHSIDSFHCQLYYQPKWETHNLTLINILIHD